MRTHKRTRAILVGGGGIDRPASMCAVESQHIELATVGQWEVHGVGHWRWFANATHVYHYS